MPNWWCFLHSSSIGWGCSIHRHSWILNLLLWNFSNTCWLLPLRFLPQILRRRRGTEPSWDQAMTQNPPQHSKYKSVLESKIITGRIWWKYDFSLERYFLGIRWICIFLNAPLVPFLGGSLFQRIKNYILLSAKFFSFFTKFNLLKVYLPEMQWWVWSQDIPWLRDTIPEMICALLTRNQARIATLNFDTMLNRATLNGLSNSSCMYFIFSLLTSFIYQYLHLKIPATNAVYGW